MPRPKGSKNKAKAVETAAVTTVEDIDVKIASVEKEIEEANAVIKAKKAELKALVKAKAEAEKAAAEKKAEEDKARILEAVAASGKSIEEILELLK